MQMPEYDDNIVVILSFLGWVIFMIATVKFAASRGRSQLYWSVLVGMFPPALFMLILMPTRNTTSSSRAEQETGSEFIRRCLSCKKLVDAEKEICPICGSI